MKKPNNAPEPTIYEMTMSLRVSPPMPTRPCRFSLGLQDDTVFADFDVGDDGRVFLRRISFDGYGCCSAPETIRRMSVDHSRVLLDAVDRHALDDSRIEAMLRNYFSETADVLWSDALSTH